MTYGNDPEWVTNKFVRMVTTKFKREFCTRLHTEDQVNQPLVKIIRKACYYSVSLINPD